MSQYNTILSKLEPDTLYGFFVGGCGSFGMNMTAYIINQKLYLVDVGLAFADDYEIGIDSYIPDIEPLIDHFKNVEAYFITHGHEDHVGALPLFLEKYPAPVYATGWTLKILEDRIQKFGSRVSPETFLVQPGDRIKKNELTVDWIHVPHSIPGCCSLHIQAANSKVFHTGDFKFDMNPPYEPSPDTAFLKSIAPVSAFISDSTNSTKDGLCPSESSVGPNLEKCFRKHPNGLIVFTTFSSNFWRLKTVLKVCESVGRKVLISGISLRKTLDIALSMGYEVNHENIVDESQAKHIARDKLLVIASGSQGEPRSGLRRIIFGEHRHVTLEKGDCIVMSSRVIPGNEKPLARLMSQAHKNGILIENHSSSPGIHVSGHAHSGDLLALMDLIKPHVHIPVHGTFTQLVANGSLHTKALPVENGSLIRFSEANAELVTHLKIDKLFIDSWSQRPMSYETMRSRHKIGDSGLCIITGTSNEVDVELIGMPFDDDNDVESCKIFVQGSVEKGKELHPNKEDFNEWLRLAVRRHLSKRFVKKPVVISKIIL